MITVHHLENSRSQRVLWLLEELGLEYTVKRYERDPVTMLAPTELRAVHPLGKSPVITDDDLTIAESGAIIEHLVTKYGESLRPKAGTKDAQKYTYYLHYAEGSLMPFLVLKLIFRKIPENPMLFFVRPIAKILSKNVQSSYINPQINLHLDFLEKELENSLWFAGKKFSAADIQMSFPVEAAEARDGITKSHHPKLIAFLETIHARPAYQAALKKGGPYQLNR
ncbi:MAG: glutathione S-transferase [bacterium]|jgi:glutathione S-transferase